MDVFSSALKNPLPPSRKREELVNTDAQSAPNSMHPNSASEPDIQEDVSYKATTTAKESAVPQMNHDNKRKNSRRRHRNSHLGCGICKKRRIKCDEHLPQCYNCIKGRLQCAYLNLDAPARNALRLAQYNQNLRDDRGDGDSAESATAKQENPPAHKTATAQSTTPPPQPPSYPSIMNTSTESLPKYASKSATPKQKPVREVPPILNPAPAGMPGQPGPLGQQPVAVAPAPGTSSAVPSMYMPMVQIHPMNAGVPFPPYPVHMMAGQPHAPMMYPNDHMQMQMMQMQMQGHVPGVGQPFMYYPTQAHAAHPQYDGNMPASYVVPMHGHYGPGMMPENPGYYPHPNDPQKANVATPAPGPPPIGVPRHPPALPQSAMMAPAMATAPPSIHPTMMSVPTPATHVPNGEEAPADPTVKLAPIQIKTDVEKPASGQGTSSDNEKISSIKMLLS